MSDYIANAPIVSDEKINFDDIPEVTDFSKATKNPFAGKFRNGYTIKIEHSDYDEIIAVTKTRQLKGGDAIEA